MSLIRENVPKIRTTKGSVNGNAARIFFMDKNHENVLQLLKVPNDETADESREFLSHLLHELRYILVSISCKEPQNNVSFAEYNQRERDLKV